MNLGAVLVLVLVAGTLPAIVRQLYPPLPLRSHSEATPRCVVVLGGGLVGRGRQRRSSRMGLRRLARALQESRQRQLPLLISGGGRPPTEGQVSEARLLADASEGFGLTIWLEERSRNTRENARNSAALLQRKGIDQVLLVTDRAHMTRAMLSFQRAGIEVIAAPVDRLPSPAWMPSAGALLLLPEIWYEWLALLWYEIRG
ncbi:YdcF family protein [Alcanivorax sp. 1008]|uniref:YdcF family protein n=1 Tax=Alcanivorax sp. 1008 TaxID=2816853 RepID=UPI001D8030F2|nr:YdcF family protein [Alcanivorax sp. 1008]MCC1496541.1 YdcF family protein [Alcanivorax sp. 1008]